MIFQDKEKREQKQQGELSQLDQVLTLQKGKGEGREAARTKLQTGEAVGGSLGHCKDCSQRNFKARRSDQALAPSACSVIGPKPSPNCGISGRGHR